MKFSEELNKYMDLLDCSSKDLSNASKLSPTIISRYTNDKRTPRVNSEFFDNIVDGLYKISEQKNLNYSKEEILETLKKSIVSSDIDYDSCINNFNTLLLELKISISDIAKAMGYDTSFISKVKNKTRKPADLSKFIDDLGYIIVQNYQDYDNKKILAELMNCPITDLDDDSKYKNNFVNWMCAKQEDNSELIKRFLTILDSFDINDYIGTDFSKIKVPSSPIILKNTKTYYGPQGRKDAEAEFLKTTLISKSKDPIYYYSNLPMAEAAEDENFKNKWVLAMSMLLKKGIHLNIIHDVNRPLNEMILGLENWIPLYMTGSISPYYFSTPPSNIFKESFGASGVCALSGESISNNLEKSKYYFTTKKEEVEYYNDKIKYMISKAKPLMTIFKEDEEDKFESFINEKDNSNNKNIQNIMFKNIDFNINKGKWVIINKLTSPELHFIIYNPKLRNAIESFLLK